MNSRGMSSGLVLLAGDPGPGTPCRWAPGADPALPDEMRWRVAEARPCAVVRLVGMLDADAVEPVRTALLTFLADQPAAVVVDLSLLTAPDPATLTVLGAAARESHRWPSGRLVISSPAPGFGESDRGGADPPELAAYLGLDPVVGAARLAREFTDDHCARWDLTELVEEARVAVTELVNNVVAHAGTPMTLRLRPWDGGLQLSVRDHSAAPPAFGGPAPPTSLGGRGLLLIDTIAREWGTSRLADGKVVWALLRPEDESGGSVRSGGRSRLPVRMGG